MKYLSKKVRNSATPASALDRAAWRFYSSKCANLSPGRRRRGILVAPGFSPASSVTFSCGRKNSKTGHQRSTTIIFVGAKTLKLKVSNYLNFTITFPMIWKCAGDFFKVLLKFKMAATDQFIFLVGAKNSKK